MPTPSKGAPKSQTKRKTKPRFKAKPKLEATAVDLIDELDNQSKSGTELHKPLTPKEAMFCEHYVVTLNAAEAARRAGYSESAAKELGYRLLTKVHIKVRIRQLKRERVLRTRWNADLVLGRLGDELDADMADLFNNDGALLPVHEWPEIWRKGLVAGFEVEELFEGHGKNRVHVGRVCKVKFSDRLKRIELIGKHTDVLAFRERQELEAGGTLIQLLGSLAGTTLGPAQVPPVCARSAAVAGSTSSAGRNPDLVHYNDDDEP